MASRTIENERDRRMTIMTTTFIPCGAKVPFIAMIAGAIFGGSAWVSTSAYFIGMAAIIISGIMLKKTKMFAGDPAPFVMDMLRAVRSKQAQRRLQAGDLWQDWIDPAKQYAACRLVFTNALGDHLHPQRLYAHHKKIAAKAGAPDARVHDLRHTFAALSLQNGDDVKTVQENLGHATAAFTLDVYGHVSERMKEDSAARMQGYF